MAFGTAPERLPETEPRITLQCTAMTSDPTLPPTSRAPDVHLVDRLNNAMDRLEITLETYGERMRDADVSSAVADAMTEDRAALAAKLDAARARAEALESAAEAAEADIIAAAKAVQAALSEVSVDVPDPEPTEVLSKEGSASDG